MKKMTRRRITALFMAVLMVVGILPLSMLTGIFSSKAQAKTIVAEMPESAKAGDTVATIGNAKLVAVQDLKNSKHETALEDDNGNTYAYGVKGTSVKNITISIIPNITISFSLPLSSIPVKNGLTTYIISIPPSPKGIAVSKHILPLILNLRLL